MKRIVFLSLIMLLISCTKGGDCELWLPPETQTGEDNVAFDLNGQTWISQTPPAIISVGPSVYSRYYASKDILEINARKLSNNYDKEIQFIISKPFDKNLYKLSQVSHVYNELTTPCGQVNNGKPFILINTSPHTFKINFLDTSKHIVSGTFEMDLALTTCSDTLKIRRGRFDIKY